VRNERQESGHRKKAVSNCVLVIGTLLPAWQLLWMKKPVLSGIEE
jgi:hypothetical protein